MIATNQKLDNYSSFPQGILPKAKSNFEYWQLPGHGKAYADCGHIFFLGCTHTELHTSNQLDGVQSAGKAYIERHLRSCRRAECPICYESWAALEAGRIEHRLKAWTVGKVVHWAVSPPRSLWSVPLEQLRSRAYAVAKQHGFVGGSCIIHPWRQNKVKKTWYYSPHFHLLGYGWHKYLPKIDSKRNAWVVKNLGVRKSIFYTGMYQLSHAGVYRDSSQKRDLHTVTWFGRLSYSKLKVAPKAEFVHRCPMCDSELVELSYVGSPGSCPEADSFWHNSRDWIPVPKRDFRSYYQ